MNLKNTQGKSLSVSAFEKKKKAKAEIYTVDYCRSIAKHTL